MDVSEKVPVDANPDLRPSAAPLHLAPVAGDPNVYRTRHDMTTDGLSVTISQALAELSGVPATELVSNFAEYADPDALDRLFRSPTPGTRTQGSVVLSIRGYRVTVHGDGRVLVAESPA